MPIAKKINKNFFKKWTREMAYVLGFFMADGNLVVTKRNGHFFSFYSGDKDILIEIQRVLESNHKLSSRTRDNSFRFQIGSKAMFNDLGFLGITPNKSKRMKVPRMSKKFIGDFVRGYFDGDGNVWAGFRKDSNNHPVIQVAFTSGSVGFLEDLLILLKKIGIRRGSICAIKNKNCGRLQLSIDDSLKLYEIMYNMPHRLYLKRKKLVFERYMKMRV